jgi:hypothetical protein
MANPDAAMLEIPERLARFLETGAQTLPPDLFAPSVVIVENFPPHLFRDPVLWAQALKTHLADHSNLQHRFEGVHDFSQTGDQAYFSLKTIWTGLYKGNPFSETGGWSFVLTRCGDAWRLSAYSWSVIACSGG